MTAHGEVVRSYEPEEMEPTKKQRFCALVHGSARLDDHAIIGDVTHERTVQRRVRQRTHELWMGTFTSGRARRSDSNQAFSLCPLVIRQERGMRHGAVHPPVLGHGCGEDLKGAYLVNMKFAELCVRARYCRRASLDSSAESVLTPSVYALISRRPGKLKPTTNWFLILVVVVCGALWCGRYVVN